MDLKPKKTVAKGTYRRTVMSTLPAQTPNKCVICDATTTARICDACEGPYHTFIGLLQADTVSTYSLFRLWRSMMERIEDLENTLEIARIKSKYEI